MGFHLDDIYVILPSLILCHVIKIVYVAPFLMRIELH
jgi:hypothetical protein